MNAKNCRAVCKEYPYRNANIVLVAAQHIQHHFLVFVNLLFQSLHTFELMLIAYMLHHIDGHFLVI